MSKLTVKSKEFLEELIKLGKIPTFKEASEFTKRPIPTVQYFCDRLRASGHIVPGTKRQGILINWKNPEVINIATKLPSNCPKGLIIHQTHLEAWRAWFKKNNFTYIMKDLEGTQFVEIKATWQVG